jgi:PTS system glucose-specific IIA component
MNKHNPPADDLTQYAPLYRCKPDPICIILSLHYQQHDVDLERLCTCRSPDHCSNRWKEYSPARLTCANELQAHRLVAITNVYSPFSGNIVDIEDVPDVVFAEKVIGDGVAVEPSGGTSVVAPVNGVVNKIFDTNEAFTMISDSGVEIFVHIGIDTEELKGEGFMHVTKEGQKVKVGDAVIRIDLPLLQERAKSTLSPIVVTNLDEVGEIVKRSGKVTQGRTVLFSVEIESQGSQQSTLGGLFQDVGELLTGLIA